MKRDNELIRKILLEVEEHGEPGKWLDIEINGYPAVVVSYHIELLDEAGYLKAKDLSSKTDGHNWIPVNLTWEGHDFLDAARDNSIWKKAKEHLGDKFQTISLSMLKDLLMNILRSQIGI